MKAIVIALLALHWVGISQEVNPLLIKEIQEALAQQTGNVAVTLHISNNHDAKDQNKTTCTQTQASSQDKSENKVTIIIIEKDQKPSDLTFLGATAFYALKMLSRMPFPDPF